MTIDTWKSNFTKLSLRSLESFAQASEHANKHNLKELPIESWILQFFKQGSTPFTKVIAASELPHARIVEALEELVEAAPRGHRDRPEISEDVVLVVEAAARISADGFRSPSIEPEHILFAALSDDRIRSRLASTCPGLERFDPGALAKAMGATDLNADGETIGSGRHSGGTVSDTLEKFTTDMTELAANGGIDPVIGRDHEVRSVVDVLLRRRQNNPILVGEPGVGKTAAVEGFALRLVAGEVPPLLKGARLLSLDIAALQAGASARGEFEARLKGIIDAVKSSPEKIILFIDEAHLIVGASGGSDMSDLLKPALARGELKTIAATTWAEYKKYIEKDAALTRRFQVVKVEEPDDGSAIAMVGGSVATLEAHHDVVVERSAVEAAVTLSRRYLPERFLPDKALSLLDTACARVAAGQHANPVGLDRLFGRRDVLEIERVQIKRDTEAGLIGPERLAEVEASLQTVTSEISALQARLVDQKAATVSYLELLGSADIEETEASRETRMNALVAARKDLEAMQGEHPLVRATVDGATIAEILSEWTGVPVRRLGAEMASGLASFDQQLAERVVGQPLAIQTVSRVMQIGRARLSDPRKPLGVFMFAGTSGVGKTETALALAEMLYGGTQALTTINMSEFKEEHKVSMLLGSPAGYVGYGEGGVLTEAVRKRPYSLILLDEIEKAHPGVQDVFYQVFDKGSLRDGEGRDIDFRNTVIVMTTNAGTETLSRIEDGDPITNDAEALQAAIEPELLGWFKPAFLGRATVVPYLQLGTEALARIVELKLRDIAARARLNHAADLTWSPATVTTVAEMASASSAGARQIDRVLTSEVLRQVALGVLEHTAKQSAFTSISIDVDPEGEFRVDLA